MARSALLNVMTGAATKAGRLLARDFGEIQNLQTSIKGSAHYAEQTFQKSKDIIEIELSRARPDYGFFTQESLNNPKEKNEYLWIIDPLDGFINFTHGLSIFSVSLALERQGQIIAGVIYNPATGELYTAERGNGAFMNDRRLRVAGRNTISHSIIGTEIPLQKSKTLSEKHALELKNIQTRLCNIFCCGSTSLSLAWVAAGRIDAFWSKNCQAYNSAAGIVLVREAGGIISDLETRQDMFIKNEILAGNQKIHDEMIKTMKIDSSNSLEKI